ncbi:MAG TPA: polyhydroxyalkanoic acid system family protein [Rhodanobacteraceae bacterium]|nr:polyhydroxyalkanoic acid system family protein [Rhodanobacteraceae bacterium]
MATIDITRRHNLGRERAREIVERIAAGMVRKYSVESSWEGDTLHIRRSGVEGRIEVGEDSVRMRAQLGLMAGMLKGTIEQEVQHQFDQHFG